MFHERFLVFFISISWFLSFCGYFLSVSGFDSSRLNDCFLTVTGCFGLHSECFGSIHAVFSCQPRHCFLDLWHICFFSRKFPGCLFYFLLTVTRVFLVNFMFVAQILLRAVFLRMRFSYVFRYLNNLLFH